jgi:hypothetical protein
MIGHQHCQVYPKLQKTKNDLGEKMGCLKGESEAKKKGAKYACGKCGAVVKQKGHACKPVKLDADKKKGSKGKTDKKKKA